MKRIFLSLPMSGRSDKEIRDQIEEMKAEFLLKNLFDKGEEIYFVDNLENDIDPSRCIDVKTEPLLYLGEAIRKLAYCDGAYFGIGAQARGCVVEMEVCDSYDIPTFVKIIEKDSFRIICCEDEEE